MYDIEHLHSRMDEWRKQAEDEALFRKMKTRPFSFKKQIGRYLISIKQLEST